MYRKLNDMNFREIYQRFVFVRKTGNFLQDFNMFDIKEPLYAYMYIDKDEGITMAILGDTENKEKYFKEERIVNVLYERVKDFEIEIIPMEDEENGLSFELEILYSGKMHVDDEIMFCRDTRYLDKFRANYNPDVVRCFTKDKTGEITQVWAKIVGKQYLDLIIKPLSGNPSRALVRYIKSENTEVLVMYDTEYLNIEVIKDVLKVTKG